MHAPLNLSCLLPAAVGSSAAGFPGLDAIISDITKAITSGDISDDVSKAIMAEVSKAIGGGATAGTKPATGTAGGPAALG
jgi:hypothetical protein